MAPIVENDDGGKASDTAHHHDPRRVLFPVEVRGASVRINITIGEGLLARRDTMTKHSSVSLSALLARGARLVLETAAEG